MALTMPITIGQKFDNLLLEAVEFSIAGEVFACACILSIPTDSYKSIIMLKISCVRLHGCLGL